MSDHDDKPQGEHGSGEAGHEEGHGKKGHGGHGGHGHGGGHEEHAGAPEWLISFADNVALLMGFFVILLAMNMKEKNAGGIGGKDKYGEASESAAMMDFIISMREAFHSPIDPMGSKPEEAALRERLKERAQRKESNETGPRGKKPEQQAIMPTGYSNVNATFPFETNSAALPPSQAEIVAEVAKRLRGKKWIIEVRGHVSAAEAVAGIGPAMELSHTRAMAVGVALVEKGLSWSQLRLVACGDSDRRVATAYDDAGHRSNQRVELVVTNETAPDDPHMRDPAARDDAASKQRADTPPQR